MIGPPLTGLLQQLHVGLLQVTWSHPSTQSFDSHSSQFPLLQGSQKQASFRVHISNKGLFELRTEWNPRVPCTVLQVYEHDRSISTTCQKFLTTCPVPVDVRCSFVRFDIVAEHHWTMDCASRIWGFVVNLISSLRSAFLMHALAPSCSPFPCPVSK